MNSRFSWRALTALICCTMLAACDQNTTSAPIPQADAAAKSPTELIVYSARKEHLIKPLFDRFTELSGIQIRYVTDKAGPLLARLKAEGNNSPADILMTVDAGNLWQASETDILQPLDSEILEHNVPANLQDKNNRWYALTIRSRTIVYSTERVKPDELISYENLADDRWAGRLCLRTSKKVYNQSLVATMIAALGEQQAETVVKGWVKNLSMDPFSNDTKVMKAIIAGQCDVGIVNTYYFGRLQNDNSDLPLALFWPNQQGEGAAGRGIHLNVSGAGVTRASKHVPQARQLLEWLVQEEAQTMLMGLNMEYPVLQGMAYSEQLASWGVFKGDGVPVSEAGRLQADAVKLMDRVGYR